MPITRSHSTGRACQGYSALGGVLSQCPTFDPFRLLVISVAGWLGQQQRDAIDYLRAENRVLREQLGDRRLRLNDIVWPPSRSGTRKPRVLIPRGSRSTISMRLRVDFLLLSPFSVSSLRKRPAFASGPASSRYRWKIQ